MGDKVASRLLAGVEAGGTKFVCAVGHGPDGILAEKTIPTTTPGETTQRVRDFLGEAARNHGPIDGLGVVSFGPVDPDPASSGYGCITRTPKDGWQGVDLLGMLQAGLNVPVGFDTDVNGAALGEWRWGSAKGLDTFVYVTVGTGIGGGGLAGGRRMHGLVHPEMGHIPVPRDPARDPFPGICPFHGDCLEGLASGPALKARWGRPASELHDRPEVWELEADYLAAALQSFVFILSPQRIILGGGVMETPGLVELVRTRLVQRLNGYAVHPTLQGDLSDFVVRPALGKRSGVLGAFALAEQTLAWSGG
jgi:fructokinase